jgi:hypothetical protein
MKKILLQSIVFLNVLTQLPVYAQDESDINRFFTDRNVRRQLDQAREQYAPVGPASDEEEEPQETLFPEVKLKGLVIRNDGSSEIWINSASTVDKGGLSEEVRSATQRINRDQVRVTLPDGKYVTLVPGQIYTPDSPKVLELYQTSSPVKPTEAPLEEELDEQARESEISESEQEEEFDESVLAETDSRIKLLEERLEKLESRSEQ